MSDEFYQDDDVRLWQNRGLSLEDAQLEAEWERSGYPDLCGADVAEAAEAALAARAIECAAREAEAAFRLSGESLQGSEVQLKPGRVVLVKGDPAEVLPTFDGNTKDDGAKAALSRGLKQYFPRALEHVAVISAGGAKKYDWNGWADVADGINRYRDAQERHDIKHCMGEIFDPDHSRYCSEPVRHLGQVAWNALAVLELILREEEKGNE